MAKAMILAAGLGTRLKPFTLTKPKALVEVNNIPLIDYAFNILIKNGFNEIVINVHHFSEQITEYLQSKKNIKADIIISDESKLLLDTGGGLKNAEKYFNDKKPFVLYNVDVITNLDLRFLYLNHLKNGALATLAVRNRKTSRYFLFNQNNFLCGWKNMATNEIKIQTSNVSKLRPMAFSGIQIINYDMFDLMNKYKAPFSITNCYIDLCLNYNIYGFNHDSTFWMDLGKPEQITEANKILTDNNSLI